KGYISYVPPQSVNCARWWCLTNHPVFNPIKPVFDCAATYKAVSLNHVLLRRPDLNNDHTGVLLRFRMHVVAITTGIEEVFLQVRVPENDRWVLSFLWGSPTNESLEAYDLKVHPFGVNSAPFSANG
ncbi:uncharacterized protein DEA37_0008279, partial [Paragonimus westermani]